jgi:hypothetical protein
MSNAETAFAPRAENAFAGGARSGGIGAFRELHVHLWWIRALRVEVASPAEYAAHAVAKLTAALQI